MSEKEKMLAGVTYNEYDEELVEDRANCARLLETFNRSSFDDSDLRVDLLGSLINHKGEFKIKQPFLCTYGYNITVGEDFFANAYCTILDGTAVTIGDRVMLAPHVSILTANHPLRPEERLKGVANEKPVVIEDDVWIGLGAIVCPGVRIGKGSVIGAGSVVTKDIPPRSVAVGNPAKVIKSV